MMRPAPRVHAMHCDCADCDPALPLRMTLIGALIGGVIVGICEVVRNFDAIVAAVLS